MLEAAISALTTLLSPQHLGFLLMGVLFGMLLGAVPGLGGIVGLTLLLPITLYMEPGQALAMMIGLVSVTATTDTIPAILFGVPGTAAAQATIMDGHPMAKRGEAGRALGASYTASLMGGLFGAVVLGLSMPVLVPIVINIGSPEFLMISLFALSMVAVLTGRAPLKGMVAALLGLSFGLIGMAPNGTLRWTMGQGYLWDGIPIVPFALGMFAVPELIDLAIKGRPISDITPAAFKGVLQGVRDAGRSWFLVLRCSGMGTLIGAIPAIGAGVVDWLAYAHALQTEKGARDSFGKGDVRGVIAPESANNAVQAGALVPTIAFGIPGTANNVLILAAIISFGMVPGPEMLTTHLDLSYIMVWSVALSNVFAVLLLIPFSTQLAKISLVPAAKLVPIVLATVVLASFLATSSYLDLVTLGLFSVLAWVMKRFGWARPPVVLGFVLAPIIERYLFISVNAYGIAWMLRPGVIFLAVLTVVSVAYGVWNATRPASGPGATGANA